MRCIFFLFAFPLLLIADVTVAGSTTLRPAVKDAADAFARSSGIAVQVRGGGSSRGLDALLEGKCDIAMVSRELSVEERQMFAVHPVAYDGIAMIVHQNNPLVGLTSEDVIGYYRGTLGAWPDGRPVTIVDKHNGRGTKYTFDHYFAIGDITPSSYRVGSNTETLLYVATDESALAYVSAGAAAEAIAKGLGVKILALDGISPTAQNIRLGRYPIRRTLYIVSAPKPSEEVRRLIAFLQSDDAAPFLERHNYIPLLHPTELP